MPGKSFGLNGLKVLPGAIPCLLGWNTEAVKAEWPPGRECEPCSFISALQLSFPTYYLRGFRGFPAPHASVTSGSSFVNVGEGMLQQG